jgi:hypothetical protein
VNSRGTVTIRWPTRVEMFLFQNLLHLTFSLCHFHVCFLMVQVISMSIDLADWAGYLLWFEDGRFANHQYFKFVSNREQ